MARIFVENGATEITPETAMNWYCWHEIVEAMENQQKALDKAIKEVEDNCADWELRVLKKFLELAENDLMI